MKDAYSWRMFEEEQIQLVRMASGNIACVTFDYEQAGNEHCFSLKSSNNREFMQMKIDYQTDKANIFQSRCLHKVQYLNSFLRLLGNPIARFERM